MTGTSKPDNSSIKAVNLVNSVFELTFDPAGKTGPADDYRTVLTENGNVTLMLTGMITEAKCKSKNS